jgi:hypothetical protein
MLLLYENSVFLGVRWMLMMSSGVLVRRILQITRVNIMWGLIITLLAPSIYTRKTHPWYYLGQSDLAL